jgi:hypothetical protein
MRGLIETVTTLQALGFSFRVEAGELNYTHAGERPRPDVVRPLLGAIRQNKGRVVAYLSAQANDSDPARMVIFPDDTKLAFPAGTWARLPDGRIAARLTGTQLKQVKAWRDMLAGADVPDSELLPNTARPWEGVR